MGQIAIANLGKAAAHVLLAAAVALRRHVEMRADLLGSLETPWIIDRRGIGQRDQHANTSCRHRQLGPIIPSCQRPHPLRRQRFAMHRSKPAQPHQLRDALRILAIGSVPTKHQAAIIRHGRPSAMPEAGLSSLPFTPHLEGWPTKLTTKPCTLRQRVRLRTLYKNFPIRDDRMFAALEHGHRRYIARSPGTRRGSDGSGFGFFRSYRRLDGDITWLSVTRSGCCGAKQHVAWYDRERQDGLDPEHCREGYQSDATGRLC